MPAAGLLHLPLDVANVADGKTRPLHGIQEVAGAGIDGDPPLGDDDVACQGKDADGNHVRSRFPSFPQASNSMLPTRSPFQK